MPYVLGKHTVSLKKYAGYILIDGYLSYANQKKLDLPDDLISDQLQSTLEFVLGKGTFGIMDGNLIRYQRENFTKIGTIKYDGIDFSKYEPYRNALWYNEASDTLFLITVTMPKDTESILARIKEENDVLTSAERKLVDSIGLYLYELPNCNISEMKFVSEITGYIQGSTFAYRDKQGSQWKYQEQNGKWTFVELPYDSDLDKYFNLAEMYLYLHPTHPYNPFYGYYCCCDYVCDGDCKSNCDCKYCD